ncbi:MAG: hypothetical protein AB1635_11515 [Acidobacteriota bacterium]
MISVRHTPALCLVVILVIDGSLGIRAQQLPPTEVILAPASECPVQLVTRSFEWRPASQRLMPRIHVRIRAKDASVRARSVELLAALVEDVGETKFDTFLFRLGSDADFLVPGSWTDASFDSDFSLRATDPGGLRNPQALIVAVTCYRLRFEDGTAWTAANAAKDLAVALQERAARRRPGCPSGC